MNSHGFTLVREERLHEAGGRVRLWKHDVTGAELLSVCNDDENKSFGVSFRTPPKDSTGVAHILEHSVLCGSDKYPVKEPFVELLKSSLQTFLNALTFPDKTCYPVASCNLQDFYNLVDVYLDAVFHPRIDENVLRQEGWHIEAEGPDSPWQFKGVVFNEMKGVYSSPDSVLMEECQHAVFPDMLYSLDSGGDPAVIPTLTFEAFREFHATYYHPSNARFFFWGDDPEEARLSRIAEVLAPYERREVRSEVPLQPRLSSPRLLEVPYAASEGEDADKAHVAVNWLLCESKDTEEMFVLNMLEHVIAGLPGSPLRKALMDSGLGEDISGCGLESDLRQAYFSMGLRSIDAKSAPEVERLMMDTLADLAENGVPAPAVEAALNSLEFMLRENNTGSFPRGLAAMFRSLSDWLYDGDAFAPLAWEKPLASIKARLASGEKVFENAIRRWFLDNPHRVTVLLLPDAGLAAARQVAEDARLAAIHDGMSEKEREEVADIAAALRAAQQKPDSQEALDTVPSLGKKDLPVENAVLPCAVEQKGGLDVVTHELDTMGILYARLAFDLFAVPSRLLPLVPLYARALTELGTKRSDYVTLGFEISAHTGSLGAGAVVLPRVSDASPVCYLSVSGKCTADKVERMTALMQEILLEPDFDNRDRFMQMVLEEKARMEQAAVPSGHLLVNTRLNGALSLAGRISEEMNGVSELFYVRELIRRVDENWESVRDDLAALHESIVRRDDVKLDMTADAALLGAASFPLEALVRRLPSRPLQACALDLAPLPGAELLGIPAQVNYVGLGLSLKGTGYVYSGSQAVILRHLRMGYLWDRVRVQGGAYGCFARYGRATEAFTFASYRDPNVENTLRVYRETADYLGNLSLSEADITRAVVGAIGDVDAYMLPGAKGATAFSRWMSGETDEQRQRIREEILATRLSDFHDFAPYLARALEKAVPCVLGGADAETAARADGWTITRVL
ncbi:insulinase family protein [uncultured Mailhella sp.]|uniref:insulinase family protein n=1 Tax=uncultured Mailhella sp. TaxID=1981031 RepID=UPI0025E11E4A|nr:insulinase family protein [uncultured Mailhella sp.]